MRNLKVNELMRAVLYCTRFTVPYESRLGNAGKSLKLMDYSVIIFGSFAVIYKFSFIIGIEKGNWRKKELTDLATTLFEKL